MQPLEHVTNMYKATKLYSYTRRIYIRFSVLRVARSSNGTPVTVTKLTNERNIDHPETLTTMHNLALTYQNQGRWDEAEKLQVEVINARKAKLRLADHPDTLKTMHNLSLTYQDQGRWDEAEMLQVEVINARKAKLGSDHPNTLNTMHSLALTYQNQGRWDEAEKLGVEVLNAR